MISTPDGPVGYGNENSKRYLSNVTSARKDGAGFGIEFLFGIRYRIQLPVGVEIIQHLDDKCVTKVGPRIGWVQVQTRNTG